MNITLSEATRKKLQKLSMIHMRSESNMIAWLIEEQAKRDKIKL